MSVLTKLMQERREWAESYTREASRRSRWALVECAMFGLLVASLALYYHRIISAVTALMGL